MTIGDAANYADELYRQLKPMLDAQQQAHDHIRPVFEAIAEVERTVRSVTQDMALAGILNRQQAAFAAISWNVRAPTEAELVETQDRLTELVPETDEERDQVAQQVAEMQADPEGQQLIEQLTDWASQIVNLLKDVPNKYKAAVSMVLVAWVISRMPSADEGKAALFCAAAVVLLMIFPPSSE